MVIAHTCEGKGPGFDSQRGKNFVVVTIVAQWTLHIPAKRVARVLFSEGKINFAFFCYLTTTMSVFSEINNYQRKNVDLRF